MADSVQSSLASTKGEDLAEDVESIILASLAHLWSNILVGTHSSNFEKVIFWNFTSGDTEQF